MDKMTIPKNLTNRQLVSLEASLVKYIELNELNKAQLKKAKSGLEEVRHRLARENRNQNQGHPANK